LLGGTLILISFFFLEDMLAMHLFLIFDYIFDVDPNT